MSTIIKKKLVTGMCVVVWGNVINNVLITMYSVGWVVDLQGLLFCELCKCLITTLFCIPETKKKHQNKKRKFFCLCLLKVWLQYVSVWVSLSSPYLEFIKLLECLHTYVWFFFNQIWECGNCGSQILPILQDFPGFVIVFIYCLFFIVIGCLCAKDEPEV